MQTVDSYQEATTRKSGMRLGQECSAGREATSAVSILTGPEESVLLSIASERDTMTGIYQESIQWGQAVFPPRSQ